MGSRELNDNPAGADRDRGGNLEDSQSDSGRFPTGSLPVFPDGGAKLDEEQVGKGAQPESELVGLHSMMLRWLIVPEVVRVMMKG